MNKFVAQRRRAQGMTEYLVLLGLIALLLIAAVRHFALAVDEAIEGTVLAWERHKDPNDKEYAGKKLPNPVGYTKPKEGSGEDPQPVYLASVPNGKGGYKWERQLAGGGLYDGQVISKAAADRW